ncbi:hypothetical protein Glove_9g342 [Diversispora epigaea]|uniref:DUF659 domain-containing protein n=1 Tax=Diversispora epigaea TaxID=1348612 RepID=A0A397JV02_9GLOM|nr:hypothetical protein Glove_9g342 [Diversispora epigaea]
MSAESSLQNEDSFDLFPSREISFITDTEEIIEDDLSNFFLSTNNINLVKRKHPGGRKTGEIWNYFIKSKDLGRGLYEAECKASSNVRIQNRKQPQITKHFDSITSLPTVKTNELDQAILKAWACCEFPFQTIENLFIIDLFRIAIPGYNLLSRLTLSGLDGWTSPRHDSIYNYIITTSTKKEYLIKLKSYNIEKQTGSFMAEEIQKVMQNIGIEKFVAVVTDYGANLRVACRIIHEMNPFILDLRCMAHAINLVASDFAEIESVKKIISNCDSIIGFFNNSHAAHGYYKEQLNIMKIKGGEIQSYCKTRWGTLYTTTNSITQSKPVFYWITENHPEVITNIKVYTLLQNEEFYSNYYQIASILKPVKELTNVLEARDANLADCFIGLIKLDAKINQISFGNLWKSIIISNYNRRLGEFINRSYILAYWLHPLYRGMGLKQAALNEIYETASIM